MADWTTIPDTQLDPDAPITSELAYAWRDNPVAISEGAAGAPRNLDASLSTTVTTAGRNWVNARHAISVAGGVGTYAFARGSNVDVEFGGTVAGSTLNPAGVGGAAGASALSGTWRCMGRVVGSETPANRSTLYLRIS